jgi:putative transposase
VASKRHKPEEIVAKLRQVDVLVSQGQGVAEAIRAIGVTEVAYYRWRREFGGLKADQVKRLKDLAAENARLRKAVADLTLDKQILAEAARGNFQAPRAGALASSMSDGSCPSPSAAPARRSGSPVRRGARRRARGRDDEERLTADIVELARRYGRFGYRKVAELLRTTAGWVVNDKRVERIWRCEGLEVPKEQSKRGRLWLADGSCLRLRPERPNHVWSDDFVEDRTHDGRRFRMLNVIDEFTRECLAIRVGRKLGAADVIDVLSDLFILRGVPGPIRSDNGPEFVAKAVQGWIAAVGAKTAYIAPGGPWENGYVEASNARLRDEPLDGEIFYSLREAQAVIESWRRHYNTARPHASLGYKPPAPEVFVPAFAARPAAPPQPAPPAALPLAPAPIRHY